MKSYEYEPFIINIHKSHHFWITMIVLTNEGHKWLADWPQPGSPKLLPVPWGCSSLTSTHPHPEPSRFRGSQHWLRVHFHQRRPWPRWRTFQSPAPGDVWGTSQRQRHTNANQIYQLQLRKLPWPPSTLLEGCHWCWASKTRGSWQRPRRCFQQAWCWWGQRDRTCHSETARPTNKPSQCLTWSWVLRFRQHENQKQKSKGPSKRVSNKYEEVGEHERVLILWSLSTEACVFCMFKLFPHAVAQVNTQLARSAKVSSKPIDFKYDGHLMHRNVSSSGFSLLSHLSLRARRQRPE